MSTPEGKISTPEINNNPQTAREASIFQMLTDAEVHEIKRRIATAFYNRLKLAQIQIILRKIPNLRSEIEIDQLIDKLKTFKSLQNKNLQYSDYRQLSQVMTYREVDDESIIYETG